MLQAAFARTLMCKDNLEVQFAQQLPSTIDAIVGCTLQDEEAGTGGVQDDWPTWRAMPAETVIQELRTLVSASMAIVTRQNGDGKCLFHSFRLGMGCLRETADEIKMAVGVVTRTIPQAIIAGDLLETWCLGETASDGRPWVGSALNLDPGLRGER